MKKETGKDACHLSRRGVVLSRKTCNLILYQSKVKLHCHGSPNPVLKSYGFFLVWLLAKSFAWFVSRVVGSLRPWENMASLRICLLPAAIVIFFLPINLFVCFLTASFLVLLLLFICITRGRSSPRSTDLSELVQAKTTGRSRWKRALAFNRSLTS